MSLCYTSRLNYGENTWNVKILLRAIDKLKQIMPWYVLEYQSKLLCALQFYNLVRDISKNTIDFQLGLESEFQMLIKCDIPLSVAENMSKKDMESFIPISTWTSIAECQYSKQGVSQTTINRTFVGALVFTSIRRGWKRPGEPYFYRNESFNKKRKKHLLLELKTIKQNSFWWWNRRIFDLYRPRVPTTTLKSRSLVILIRIKERDLYYAFLWRLSVRLSEAVNLDLKRPCLKADGRDVTRKVANVSRSMSRPLQNLTLENYLAIRNPTL